MHKRLDTIRVYLFPLLYHISTVCLFFWSDGERTAAADIVEKTDRHHVD